MAAPTTGESLVLQNLDKILRVSSSYFLRINIQSNVFLHHIMVEIFRYVKFQLKILIVLFYMNAQIWRFFTWCNVSSPCFSIPSGTLLGLCQQHAHLVTEDWMIEYTSSTKVKKPFLQWIIILNSIFDVFLVVKKHNPLAQTFGGKQYTPQLEELDNYLRDMNKHNKVKVKKNALWIAKFLHMPLEGDEKSSGAPRRLKLLLSHCLL